MRAGVKWCERCDYRLDLHPRGSDDPEPWECEAVATQERLAADFWRIVTTR